MDGAQQKSLKQEEQQAEKNFEKEEQKALKEAARKIQKVSSTPRLPGRMELSLIHRLPWQRSKSKRASSSR